MIYLRGDAVRVWIPGHGYHGAAAEILWYDVQANVYRVEFADGTTAWSTEQNLSPRNAAFYKPDNGEDCR